ncbi:MAG: hypothetical protein QNL51_02555 [Opitutaceae bacterium]
MVRSSLQLLRLSMAALGLLAAAGCTSNTYNVKINAIANEAKASGESYRIVTKNGGDPNTDLRTREAVDYVKAALSGRGLYEAPNPASADMVVEVDYDVEPPRVEFESRSVPIFARMGGGVRSVIVPTRDSNGNIQYRRVSVMDPPSQELIGFEEKTIPVTVYEKYLRVSARENVSSGDDAPPEQLWSVYVSNEAEDDDIRKALPVLASVVVDYIGVTTETDEEVKVNSETDEVAFIKRGL